MKILLDENTDFRVKDILEPKFNVETTRDENLSSESDREILEFAEENSFVILTHDDDFLSLINNRESFSTIVFLPQRIRFREMKKRLKKLPETIPEKNEIIYL